MSVLVSMYVCEYVSLCESVSMYVCEYVSVCESVSI